MNAINEKTIKHQSVSTVKRVKVKNIAGRSVIPKISSHAKNGPMSGLINIHNTAKSRKGTRKMDLENTTFVETQKGRELGRGALPIIKSIDGSIVQLRYVRNDGKENLRPPMKASESMFYNRRMKGKFLDCALNIRLYNCIIPPSTFTFMASMKNISWQLMLSC